MRRYFEMAMDGKIWPHWFPHCPHDKNGDQINRFHFKNGQYYTTTEERLYVPIFKNYHGKEVDFFDPLMTPYVRADIAEAVQRLCPDAVQLIPVEIETQTRPYVILNILDVVDCLDEQRTESFDFYTEASGPSHLIGQYKWLYGRRIDPIRAAGHKIFWLGRDPLTIIIDDEMKALLESFNTTGFALMDVT
jgi:hypothetical protein